MAMARISIIGSLVVSLGLGMWYSGAGRTAAGPTTVKPAPGTAAKPTQARRSSPRRVLPKLDPTVLERWRMNPSSDEDIEVDPEQLADEEERDAMLAEDRLPEQAVWRSAWLSEREDEQWTRAMAEEMRLDGETLAHGHLTVRGLSCRETVCRLYLDLSDADDIEAFLAVERDPNLHYEFQLMNPGFEAESDDDPDTDYHFEVLVAREDAFEQSA